MNIRDNRARENLDAGLLNLGHRWCVGVAARIDNGHDLDTRREQIKRCRPTTVRRGENHRALSRSDGEAIDVGCDCRCHHDAGPVVATEHQRPLDRACRENGSFRDDLPKTLARLAGERSLQMI